MSSDDVINSGRTDTETTKETVESIPPEMIEVPTELAVLAVLRTELTELHSRAAAREEIILRLHDEVQSLRGGEHATLMRPAIVDLARLRNGLLRQAAEMGAEPAAVLFEGFADEAALALERLGAQPLSPVRGEVVVTGAHRVIGIVTTESTELDGTVAVVDSDGYFDTVNQKVVMPAAVHAHRAVRRPEPAAFSVSTEEDR